MRNCKRVTALVAMICLVCAMPSVAKDAKPPKLFSEAGEMTVTLTGPWRRIKRNIKKDDLYPAQLAYMGADGQQHTFDVKVAPRGLTRRLKVCDFPPLKVHFDKEITKDTEFRGDKSLKLVTYCDTPGKYEQYYIKEFLAYRIYNLITEYSFRVRPMMITYQDSEKRKDSLTRFSFLIEDLDEVADRNDLEKLSVAQISHKHLDAAEISKFSLFQYLIGNLDWSAFDGPGDDDCCHNSKLIGKDNESIPKYGIPYDFDSSGLVDAHYAMPPSGLGVRNVRQRLYRGFCFANDALPGAVELFNRKKPDIMALFHDNRHLSDRVREQAIKYIEEFYETINDPKEFGREITGKCRG
ncbi:MAG: hypothetical protein PVF46_09255 [Lysobacterales bacterium]|jgi:hypothetical protein